MTLGPQLYTQVAEAYVLALLAILAESWSMAHMHALVVSRLVAPELGALEVRLLDYGYEAVPDWQVTGCQDQPRSWRHFGF